VVAQLMMGGRSSGSVAVLPMGMRWSLYDICITEGLVECNTNAVCNDLLWLTRHRRETRESASSSCLSNSVYDLRQST